MGEKAYHGRHEKKDSSGATPVEGHHSPNQSENRGDGQQKNRKPRKSASRRFQRQPRHASGRREYFKHPVNQRHDSRAKSQSQHNPTHFSFLRLKWIPPSQRKAIYSNIHIVHSMKIILIDPQFGKWASILEFERLRKN
jgi:hypothetical protein